jgi:hypothetical protein
MGEVVSRDCCIHVPYSNIKLTFDSPTNGHFGVVPLEGVARK